MPVLDKPRWERMAQLLASGKSAVDAHEQAGFARHDSNSSHMANKSEIKARVAEIIGKSAEKAQITQNSLVEDCKRVQRLAEEASQFSVSLGAIKEIGILTGKRIERSERGAPGEFDFLEKLTPDQLEAYAKGELDPGDLGEGESLH